jgi:hypothetical protein
MKDQYVIIKNGKYYVIDKDKYEISEKFLDRCWFIVNCMENTKLPYSEILQCSRIWSNIKFNNCSYDNMTMDKINTLENNIYKKNEEEINNDGYIIEI